MYHDIIPLLILVAIALILAIIATATAIHARRLNSTPMSFDSASLRNFQYRLTSRSRPIDDEHDVTAS